MKLTHYSKNCILLSKLQYRNLVALVAILSLAALASACGGAVDQPSPDTLVIALESGPTYLDPRYATDAEPPTLYTRQLAGGRGMLVVSEPLDGVREGWTAVPSQHVITATAQDITLTTLPAATRLAQAA